MIIVSNMQGLKNLPPLHPISGNHQECISSNQRKTIQKKETIQKTVLNHSTSFEELKAMSLQNEKTHLSNSDRHVSIQHKTMI